MDPNRLSLDPQQTLDTARLFAELDGFVAGAKAMADHLKRSTVQAIALKKQQAAAPVDPSPAKE